MTSEHSMGVCLLRLLDTMGVFGETSGHYGSGFSVTSGLTSASLQLLMNLSI